MAMQRARRLASVAVVASLAVTGLSACRAEPSVAAYIGGSSKITESRVQDVFDEVTSAAATAEKAPAQPGQAVDTGPVVSRADVLRTLLTVQVLGEVAKRQSVTLPADLSLTEYATALRVPAQTEYLRLYAQGDTLIKLLRQKAQNAPAASDEVLRQVYDVLITNQEIPATAGFAEFKANLPEQNKVLVQSASAVRQQISEVADGMDIKVNPRYQPVGISVLEFQTQAGELRPLVTAPLGDEDDAAPVTDLS
jgi:hypothetical protein